MFKTSPGSQSARCLSSSEKLKNSETGENLRSSDISVIESKFVVWFNEREDLEEEEEEALGIMAELNESAVDAIQTDEYDNALEYLKRAEEVVDNSKVSQLSLF
ncbi:hypothetical protein COB52_03160 [Candidatus Kaiserbacteria bacterium]|nr:MAG: hypothetical protein COB52_03160 [Candidatus Kaiserbacteria bacterium]